MAKLPNRLARHGDGSALRAELAEPHAGRARFVFFQSMVSAELESAALVEAWVDTIDLWCEFTAGYPWGGKVRKAKFRALARNPRVLAATQAAVAHCDDANIGMLAVLATDGSAGSVDALIRHFQGALTDRDRRLDVIVRLRTHAARTPALQTMLDELDAALAERRASSPILALGPVIGLGKLSELWFWAIANARHCSFRIEIDSRRAFGEFSVLVQRGRALTLFGSSAKPIDDLKLGTCDPAGLPAWLANAAATLGVRWKIEVTRTGLRGRKRERVAAWLGRT